MRYNLEAWKSITASYALYVCLSLKSQVTEVSILNSLTPNASAGVAAGQPARLEATFAKPCFSKTGEEPAQTIENRSEGPDIALRLLDVDGQHAVPCTNADRCVHPVYAHKSKVVQRERHQDMALLSDLDHCLLLSAVWHHPDLPCRLVCALACQHPRV